MNCQKNVNSILYTQLPHKFSYIVAILIHNHFESPNIIHIYYKAISICLNFDNQGILCCIIVSKRLSNYCNKYFTKTLFM
jgi:hypothetical protein